MWIRFLADFDYSPAEMGGLVTVAYKAGTIENVPTPCATLAIAAGKAEKTKAPRGAEPEKAEIDGKEADAG